MERLKGILKKLFFLPPLPTVLIAVPSFIFVFVILGVGDKSFFSYVAYFLSAYAMIITVTGIAEIVNAVHRGFDNLPLVKKLRSHPLGDRILDDDIFRSELTLCGGLFANLLYVALNVFSGIRYRSAWFITLAFYYLLLSIMRAMLVRYVHRKPLGVDIPAELRYYRACGAILVLMNQALIGIVVYMVYLNRGFSYPGLLIYAMATYTFYITISAIVNVIKYRKRGSPILSSAKAISLTAALVSMLSLETAMLARFGGGQPRFRQIMTGVSGAAVCVIVLSIAVYMIANSTKQLKKRKINDSQT